MVIDMNDAKLTTLAQLKAFLDGSAVVDFGPAGDDLARYAHITAVLARFGYRGLRRTDRGLVRRYLMMGRSGARPPAGKCSSRYRVSNSYT